MLASARPYGPVIRPGSPTKIRGAVLLQASGQWPFFAQFWSDWDWTTIKRTIDNLAGLGVNCLQITATGISDGYPSVTTYPDTATMRARITQLASYAAGYGMMLNPQLAYQAQVQFNTPQGTGSISTANLRAGTAAAVAMARLFAGIPNIACIDAFNEVDVFSPWSSVSQAASDMAYFCGQIRPVIGAIPLTVSCSTSNGRSDIAGAWQQAMAPLCDFHNVHTYYSDGTAGNFPSSADFAALRAAPWYLGRFIVGETGATTRNYSASGQTAYLNGNGAVAAASDCLGSILWGATETQHGSSPTENYDVSGFGIMDSTGTTLRTSVSVPVSNWPAVL